MTDEFEAAALAHPDVQAGMQAVREGRTVRRDRPAHHQTERDLTPMTPPTTTPKALANEVRESLLDADAVTIWSAAYLTGRSLSDILHDAAEYVRGTHSTTPKQARS